VRIADLAFEPEELVVVRGDNVLWFWDGGETNHSVTADPGQAESFDSDPDKPADQVRHKRGDAFGHKFTRDGTYTYTCKVHSFMKGRVVVQAPAGSEPPAPDPTPAPDGSTVAVSDLSLRPARVCRRGSGCPRATLLRFTLSDTATVRVRLLRGERQARAWRLERDGGRHRLRIRARGLSAGRYQLVVQATTPDGARSPAVTRRLRVR
jgi:plastocyanin